MTDEVIRAIEAAKTEEEEKAVAEKYKLTIRLLSDEELDYIAGGAKPYGVPDTYTSSCDPDCTKRSNKCWCPKYN